VKEPAWDAEVAAEVVEFGFKHLKKLIFMEKEAYLRRELTL
jgi:hypothetical protein